ncbi:MAG: hypothetical protein H6502_00100 [Candidatus Woesearchaeota archaeon]|nr:MAG: hypothetical protein H6502_00100 [Candidatus Woesearchaeota archaeon]
MNRKSLLVMLVFAFVLFQLTLVSAQTTCGVYFSGIGCPHCAKVDPVLLGYETLTSHDLLVIDYEIYQKNAANGAVMLAYTSAKGVAGGVPFLLVGDIQGIGDSPILRSIDTGLLDLPAHCALERDGAIVKQEARDVLYDELPGRPVVWYGDRAMERTDGASAPNDELLAFLFGNETPVQEGSGGIIPLSGYQVGFAKSKEIAGWTLLWDRYDDGSSSTSWWKRLFSSSSVENSGGEEKNLTLTGTILLALADAINPCALAVLVMILVSITTANPKNKNKVLLGGLLFTGTVFVIYLFYGLVLIKLFTLLTAIKSVQLYLYKVLAVLAFVLAYVQIKDYVTYKPGSLGSEMPLSMRPKVKKILSAVTSPLGAIIAGAFVTIFLLPCTIGPYLIFGGIASVHEFFTTLPYLLLYNFIFVLPMLIITFIIYFGVTRVEKVGKWKDRHIRLIHLWSGIVIAAMGLIMLFS